MNAEFLFVTTQECDICDNTDKAVVVRSIGGDCLVVCQSCLENMVKHCKGDVK